MKKLLQVDFNFSGPFGEEMSQQLVELAESINQEPGMIWKIWTESHEDKIGGGIYLFENREYAEAYLQKHSERLVKMGASNIRGYIFDLNVPLSEINSAPIHSAGEIKP